jgi:haloalkane dehalogenase
LRLLRTPEERFIGLPDYPFDPHYVTVEHDHDHELRMHYVDEGPRRAPAVLMMHGEPSWSYLYRHFIPPISRAGYRVLAPDLIGFGRSDKPASVEDYSYEQLVAWTRTWFDAVDPHKVTLVAHGWGGLIGLRIVAAASRRFTRVIAMNTGLPTGREHFPAAFFTWQQMAHNMPVLPVSHVVQGGCLTNLPPDVMAAYDAPFPSEEYKAGVRALPALVPTTPDAPSADENRQAWRLLRRWSKPFLTIFSDVDPITAGVDEQLQAVIPGAEGQPHTRLRHAGHFAQEDRVARLIKVICRFLRST